MRSSETARVALAAALCLGLAAAATAQYGLIDSFETAPVASNLYGGGAGFFSGGAGGGGAGELGGIGVGGSAGIDGGAGGDFAGGLFYGYANSLPGVDTTVSFAGMSTTGVALDFLDRNGGGAGSLDGDLFGIRVESGGFSNSTTWNFSASLYNTYQTQSFLFTHPPSSVQGAGMNPASITNVVFVGVGFNGGTAGDATFRFDNLRFIGDNSPSTGDVEDYEAYALGPSSPGPNSYGGTSAAFQYGGTIAAQEVVDLGGNRAFRVAVTDTQSPARGGLTVGCLPVAGTVDVSAFVSLKMEVRVAAADVGDQFSVQLETADSPGAPTFWHATITPTATLSTVAIPFSSLVGGPGVSFDPALLRQISVVATAETGTPNNAFDITIDNVRFSTDTVPAELSVFSAN